MKKTKEELLKIYSAYLPYELEGITIYHNTDDGAEKCKLSTKDDLNNVVGIDDWVNQYNYPIKPILYSMDMLTKEIEHKGEKIKFADYFRQKYEPEIISDFAIKMWEHDFANTIMYDDYLLLPYYYIQELLAFHFNVFRLDESEYIKKESLNRSENPNS